ncbi:helix-turn-helix transcriptional regulator [Lapidilactobacillus luobeiensis]|uniref:helix-turn-helix transcriptional regulator n=1 Tax=Lapidilactobacillus luobeiensis TaxID=2950371 RepID=UPI0021C266C7|nr:AraC family transcriptional regulator [Lapidilactobacillus luobeiensis]
MSYADAKTFNPEILYAYDPWNKVASNYNLHSHDFLEISIMLEGQSHYFIDEHWADVQAGQIMLFNPGVRHGEQQRPETYSHQLHLGIKNISLHGLPRNFLPTKKSQLAIGEYQYKIIDKAWQLVGEIDHQDADYQLIGKGIIIEILVYILRGLTIREENYIKPFLSKTEKKQNHLVDSVIYFLENHYTEDITLEQLARDNYVSPAYLSRIFKEATDMSPINYLIQIRLKNAHALLKNETETTVKEIASAVGYEDAYHFSKLFKKYYGVSPSQVEDK